MISNKTLSAMRERLSEARLGITLCEALVNNEMLSREADKRREEKGIKLINIQYAEPVLPPDVEKGDMVEIVSDPVDWSGKRYSIEGFEIGTKHEITGTILDRVYLEKCIHAFGKDDLRKIQYADNKDIKD